MAGFNNTDKMYSGNGVASRGIKKITGILGNDSPEANKSIWDFSEPINAIKKWDANNRNLDLMNPANTQPTQDLAQNQKTPATDISAGTKEAALPRSEPREIQTKTGVLPKIDMSGMPKPMTAPSGIADNSATYNDPLQLQQFNRAALDKIQNPQQVQMQSGEDLNGYLKQLSAMPIAKASHAPTHFFGDSRDQAIDELHARREANQQNARDNAIIGVASSAIPTAISMPMRKYEIDLNNQAKDQGLLASTLTHTMAQDITNPITASKLSHEKGQTEYFAAHTEQAKADASLKQAEATPEFQALKHKSTGNDANIKLYEKYMAAGYMPDSARAQVAVDNAPQGRRFQMETAGPDGKATQTHELLYGGPRNQNEATAFNTWSNKYKNALDLARSGKITDNSAYWQGMNSLLEEGRTLGIHVAARQARPVAEQPAL